MEAYPKVNDLQSPFLDDINMIRCYVDGTLVIESSYLEFQGEPLPIIGGHTSLGIATMGHLATTVADSDVVPHIDWIDDFAAGVLIGDTPEVPEITESFNGPDSRTIGPDLTWVKDGREQLSTEPDQTYIYAPDDGVVHNGHLAVDGGVTGSSSLGYVSIYNTSVLSSSLVWAECTVHPGAYSPYDGINMGNRELHFSLGVRVPAGNFPGTYDTPTNPAPNLGGYQFTMTRFWIGMGTEGPDLDGTWFSPSVSAYVGNGNAPGPDDILLRTDYFHPIHWPKGTSHRMRIEAGSVRTGTVGPRDTGTAVTVGTRVRPADEAVRIRTQ